MVTIGSPSSQASGLLLIQPEDATVGSWIECAETEVLKDVGYYKDHLIVASDMKRETMHVLDLPHRDFDGVARPVDDSPIWRSEVSGWDYFLNLGDDIRTLPDQ
ncbi:MAG TPA: hypothetical protein VNY74_09185 [Edaphobacter sp.]|nr:hypothetical protein [Edaphobacter sp.]